MQIPLYAKWVPKPATVEFDSAGGSTVDNQTVSGGSGAKKPADPTKTGATFIAWYYVSASGEALRWEFERTVDNDIKLVALWHPIHTTIKYSVIHRTSDGTELFVKHKEVPQAVSVSAKALAASDSKRRDYPYVDAESKSLTLSPDDASNVITFTYSSNPQNTYVVHYVDRDSGSQLKSNTTMTSLEVLIALDAPRIANYTVDGDGHGYVSLRIHEWTFFYMKDSAPTTPTTPATPSTPDTSNPPTTGAQTPGTTTPPSSSQQNPTSTSRVAAVQCP